MMRIIVGIKQLGEIVKKAVSLVSESNAATRPVLGHIALQVHGDRLQIKSTDAVVFYQAYMSGKEGSNGQLTVPAQSFHNYLTSVPQAVSEVLIEETQNGRVKLVYGTINHEFKFKPLGKNEIVLAGLDWQTFPLPPAHLTEAAITVNGADLRQKISQIDFSISGEEEGGSAAKTSLMLKTTADSLFLGAVCSTSFAGAVVQYAADPEPGAANNQVYLIHRDSVRRLLGILDQKPNLKPELTIAPSTTRNHLVIKRNDETILVGLQSVTPAPIDSYTEKFGAASMDYHIIVEPRALEAAIKRLAYSATTSDGNATRLDHIVFSIFADEHHRPEFNIVALDSEFSGQSDVSIVHSDFPVFVNHEIAVNVKLFITLLGSLRQPYIRLSFDASGRKPIVVEGIIPTTTNVVDSTYAAFMMPVSIREQANAA